MIEKLRASWRSYREKRLKYQNERATYKAQQREDARHFAPDERGHAGDWGDGAGGHKGDGWGGGAGV